MSRLLLWAAVALGALLLLWRVDHLSADRMTLQLDLDRMSARAESLQSTLRLQRELIADAEELDRKHIEELKGYEAELEELRGSVARGDKRLLVSASCPDTRVPDTAGAASMDDAGRAELNPAARQDYFTLRSQLIKTEAALAGLQDYVRTVYLRSRATE